MACLHSSCVKLYCFELYITYPAWPRLQACRSSNSCLCGSSLTPDNMRHSWSASPAPDCTPCGPCAAIQPSKCMLPRSTGSHTWPGHLASGQQLTAGQHHIAEVCAHSESLMGASAAPARMLWCSCLVQARNGGTCQCTLPSTCTMHGTESSCAAAMHLEMKPAHPPPHIPASTLSVSAPPRIPLCTMLPTTLSACTHA